MTTVWACEKTVVMVKQPGHLTSMKKERGAGTSVWDGFTYVSWFDMRGVAVKMGASGGGVVGG